MEEAGHASTARWAIYDRLKNLPILYSTNDSGISPARTFKLETTKSLVEKEVQTEVDDPPDPEEHKWEMLSQYSSIPRNEFVQREHVTQKEDDIAVCNCKCEEGHPESVCGERCLNLLTSTECTPGHCPCGALCKNQRFQRCECAKVKLVRTASRGWGLLADQDIKEGEFVMEYCGEVISDKVAQSRVHVYEAAGVKDKYIIALDGSEFIDATRKGSLARFINHSCEPNCVTRKWTVLGEVRIGIFAIEDINAGTELSYNYNFQWYGGDKVRCRCGAPSCAGFLGARSRGFQKDALAFVEEEYRGTPERPKDEDPPLELSSSNLTPLHQGSSSRELLSSLFDIAVGLRDFKVPDPKPRSKSTQTVAQSLGDIRRGPGRPRKSTDKSKALQSEVVMGAEKVSLPALKKGMIAVGGEKEKIQAAKLQIERTDGTSKNQMPSTAKQLDVVKSLKHSPGTDSVRKIAKPKILRAESSKFQPPVSALEDEEIKMAKKQARKAEEAGFGRQRATSEEHLVSRKKARFAAFQQSKNMVNQFIHALSLNQQLLPEAVSAEVAAAQEEEVAAAAEMAKVFDEIRPILKEHEKAGNDSFPAELTERWIAATSKQLRTAFDFHFTVVRHLAGPTQALSGAGVSFPEVSRFFPNP